MGQRTFHEFSKQYNCHNHFIIDLEVNLEMIFLRDVLETVSTMLIRLTIETLATQWLTEIQKLLACSLPLITAVASTSVFSE